MSYNDPSRPYMPSNGTEGIGFMEAYCDRCAREDGFDEGGEPLGKVCEIIGKTMMGEQVPEWIYGPDGRPTCTAFGERVDPAERPPRCPDTLDLFAKEKP